MGFHPIPGFFFCVPKRITKKRATNPQIVSYLVCFSPACLPVGRLGKIIQTPLHRMVQGQTQTIFSPSQSFADRKQSKGFKEFISLVESILSGRH
jgi:hypothetical protein